MKAPRGNMLQGTAITIQKRPGVCGGAACIRDTRYTVWGLVELRRLGSSDTAILDRHPSLTGADLQAAWEYASAHPEEIERALWENEACMVERAGAAVPSHLVLRGLQLGISEADIRDAFEPPLTADELRAAVATNGLKDWTPRLASRNVLP